MSSASTTRRPDIACSILVIGAIAYVCLCMPAIGRRGYPPIDPIWLGVTHLWIAPVCLSAMFDSFSFWQRRYHLAIYAIVTAFFNAGTIHIMTPRHVDPLGMVMFTVIPYGPIHLLGTFGAEALLQLLLRPARTLNDAPNDPRGFPRVTLLSWLVGFSVICLAIGFPFTYRSLSIDSERVRGESLADEQWASGGAVVFHEHDDITASDAYVRFHVDPDTGLTRRHQMSDMGFRDAYNARIAELIKIHGLPDWSLKEHTPSAEDVAALLDSKDLIEITSFPHELTPSIVLMRRGTITRWGSTFSSGSDSLSIATERSGIIGVGNGVHPVHVRITDPIVVIRNGKTWVAVFHKNSRMIASASRF